MDRVLGRRLGTGLTYLALGLVSCFVLFPFLWMVSVSLKPEAETFQVPPVWVPLHPTLDNFVRIWSIQPFALYFRNSLIVASSTAIVATAFAALAGYGFSRFKMRGAKVLLSGILITQMFPGVLLVIPYFIMMNRLGLLNTYLALIIADTSFALPFATWLLRGFFEGIPRDLDEAALIDGCSRLSAFWRVVLPLTLPGLAATLIFTFLLGWSEFLFALALTSQQPMFVVTVGVASLIGQYHIAWNEMMAMAVISIFPVLVLFLFLEQYLVQGLTAGAVKG